MDRKIVFIGATYCPRCKQLEREYLRVAKRFKKRVEFINADKNYVRTQKYGQIKHVPVLVKIDNGFELIEKNFPTADEIMEWFRDEN